MPCFKILVHFKDATTIGRMAFGRMVNKTSVILLYVVCINVVGPLPYFQKPGVVIKLFTSVSYAFS